MIPRKLSEKLLQLINNKADFNNVILLEGARQVGKTTLIRETLQKNGILFREVNLEEQKSFSERIDQCKDFEEFSDVIQLEAGFKIGGGSILFVDEAQESQKLGGHVRFMKEKWKDTQVILSGSSMARIFRDNVRFPVGRVTLLHLMPFSFTEFLSAGNDELRSILISAVMKGEKLSVVAHGQFLNFFEKYIEVGGLPEVVTSYFAETDWQKIRDDILFGYYNDFKRVFGEERQLYFIAAMRAVADLLGQPFKNSHVSRLTGGGRNDKILESLAQLEAWKIVFNILQNGPQPTQNFHPKRYLFDLGIARKLRESSVPSINLTKFLGPAQRIPLGGIIENAALLSLIESDVDISGWKKALSGSEVDFIVKHKGQTIPFECKSVLSVKGSHLGGLVDYMHYYDLPLGIVVSLAPYEIKKIPGERHIINLPLYLVEYWKEMLF